MLAAHLPGLCLLLLTQLRCCAPVVLLGDGFALLVGV
jgi:hypothetical protein